MTGKQALYDLIDEIKYTHNDGVSLTPFDQKRVDAIMKDLEVLDILKKYIRAGQWSNEYTLLSWEMKSKELTKIKEWLNNDK